VGSTYKADAVVVGGGLTGMTAALEIASSSRPVILDVKID
jgi:succinate dehydrogenase/fumarate reductase flavoprotein subunit